MEFEGGEIQEINTTRMSSNSRDMSRKSDKIHMMGEVSSVRREAKASKAINAGISEEMSKFHTIVRAAAIFVDTTRSFACVQNSSLGEQSKEKHAAPNSKSKKLALGNFLNEFRSPIILLR
jgi:hypothetical protein